MSNFAALRKITAHFNGTSWTYPYMIIWTEEDYEVTLFAPGTPENEAILGYVSRANWNSIDSCIRWVKHAITQELMHAAADAVKFSEEI